MGGSSSQPRTDPAMSLINAFPVEDFYTRWVAISKNSKHGNARRKDGFWCEVLAYIESKTKAYGRRMYDMVCGKWKTVRPAMIRFCGVYSNVMRIAQDSGAGDEDYVQRAMIHYQAETGLPFKFRHCWDVLKDSLKWKEITLPNFNTGSEGDEVQEIRRPGGRDKARAIGKNKGSKASGSSTMNYDALAREVECRERDVAAQEYRQQQEDMWFYLQPYDHLTGDQQLAVDEARAKIKPKYNLQY
ncbi:hypothetical protein Tco_1045101 [Tanacetum coccineum]|uniref:No apical meristem-associated C-terminal domain-containing protein n=1 Tax=Tanacetum coccineum TaxID=301880 RepID=A0ABQ5GRS8_9ASTR